MEGVVDLHGKSGTGPPWSMASTDLNATLLSWPPGYEVAEHVDAEPHSLTAGSALLIRRGARRRLEAGTGGLRYLSTPQA